MKFLFLSLIVFGCLASQIHSELIVNSTLSAVNYLEKFGYVNKSEELSVRSGNFELEKFLLKFQEFFKLKKTGKLDKNTLKIMNSPRCGVADLFPNKQEDPDEKRRHKRYAAQGSTWKKTHITWTISKFSKRSNLRNKQRQIIRVFDRAFSYWAASSNLKFSYVKSNGDIDIRFETFDHRDGSPFDNEGGTLAHAFFPRFGGDCHIDDSEPWTLDDNDTRGTNLLSVAIHELGHSLGLMHSNVEESIMYPTYDGEKISLAPDDIKGIQSLYGPPNEKPVQAAGKKNDYEDLCDSFDVDAGLCYKPQYCIVFKGNLIYKFKSEGNGIASGYPKKIGEIFLTMNGTVDAAFKSDDKMYLIKKDIVFEFEKFFTKPIRVFNFRKLIPGLKLKHVDAIYRKKRTGAIYIFSEEQYWRFNPERGLSPNYPKPISNWDNLPSGIDAVLDWNENETLFFRGDQYWVYNEITNRMKNSEPKNVQQEWLKC